MKKAVKFICGLLVAVILTGGGYIAGQRMQKSSIVSALPKNIVDVPKESAAPNETVNKSETKEELIEQKNDVRIINKSSQSAVDSTWTTVESSANTTDNGALTLYTSAEKIDDEIIWDDGQKWVVEVSDGNGEYYTLLDQYINNGGVYYEVNETEGGDRIINVYIFTGAGTTIKQYTHNENGYAEKIVYETGAVNRVFTTVPTYK